MSGGTIIEIGEFLLPGTSAVTGAQIAAAFQREVARLWEGDRAAGVGWDSELGTLTLDLDPGLDVDALAEAIARKVQARARRDGPGGGRG